jgi:DNA-binding response OmpR family regulator
VVDVARLRWPADETARAELAARGAPRLLVISPTGAPPECFDPLEDWVREPVCPDELEARVTTLARRATGRECRPSVDDAGVVWLGTSSITLSTAQVAVVRLLVTRFAQIVPAAHIQAAYRDGGGSTHPKAVKAMIGRVRQRMAELELSITNIRDRGYLLGPGGPGDHQV